LNRASPQVCVRRLVTKPPERVVVVFTHQSFSSSGLVTRSVKSESHDAQKYEYTWELQYWSQLHEKHIIEKHDNGSFMAPAHGVLKIPLDTHLFLHEGEYHLIVNMIRGIDKQQENKVQTLVTFKVLSYDVFYADVFKTLMVGFLGAIVGALLTIYFTKR